ncbi:hypothetical protein RvY_09865 [Ramazzottius varieornatus]|uniref:Peptidase M20 domain-containing protein 2 n=1 Tax=Ramazzottius varieornatus TaxID=947166 RepID=A0A1D1VG72_RAMVA|nr:hypothetical protein RvY_09865 [Ramazzottius varieornatus]
MSNDLHKTDSVPTVSPSAGLDGCLDELDPELRQLSLSIWIRPELAYEEFDAHDVLTAFLENKGLTVTRHYCLPTAYLAEYRSPGYDPALHPTIAYLSEYDALPQIGHACGHNLIAIAGVAASLGCRRLMEDSRKAGEALPERVEGRILCVGCPAEETTGGKIDLLMMDAFSSVDFCMMVHPYGYNIAEPEILGLLECEVEIHGNELDAGLSPWECGAAATDCAVLLYSSLSLLRRTLQPGNQIHGVILEAGRPQSNRKSFAKLHFYLRTRTTLAMDRLKAFFFKALQSVADLYDCTFETKFAEDPFEGLVSNNAMARVYRKYGELLGLQFPRLPPTWGSTDMGNVSNAVPSIHPFFAIGDPSLTLHTKDFQVASGTPEAHQATVQVAKVIALVGFDLLRDKSLQAACKTDFYNSPASSSRNRSVRPE